MKLQIYCFQNAETMIKKSSEFGEALLIGYGSHSDLMDTVLDIVKNGCEKPIFTPREELVLLIGKTIFWQKIMAENVELYFCEDGEMKQSAYLENGMIRNDFPLGYFMGNYKEFLEKLKEIN